jgi:hypothetical protein
MYSDMSKRRNSTPRTMRQLARDFGLADAGGAGEQERADRLALLAEARARHLDGRRQRLDRLVLAEDHQLQVALEVAQHLAVDSTRLRRDARDARHHFLDVCGTSTTCARRAGLRRCRWRRPRR